MARGYRAREDGLFEVETPDLGFVPVHWGEDQLRAQGLEPLAPPSGRLAQNGGAGGTGGDGGPGNVPESRSDVSGGGWDPSMGGAPGFVSNPNAGTGTQSSTENEQEDTPMTATNPETGKVGEVKPKGPKTEEYKPGGQAQAPPRPRYATTKAEDRKVAWRVDKGPQLDPENEEFRSEAEIDTRLQMQERADQLERQALQNVEEFEKRVMAPLSRQISSDQIKQQRRRQEYAKRQKEIDDERAAIAKLEIDPKRLFKDKGAWAGILAGISIIAGGALQGLQGRSNNPGLDAVNDAIDRDVQLQKDQFARRREGLQAKETAFEKLVERYGDPELAERELRSRQEALASAWAKRMAMKNGAEDIQANLQQAFNDRDLARVEEQRQLDQAFGDRISEQWQHVPAQTYQVGGQRALKPEARERQVRVDGKTGFVVAPGARDKVQESVNTFDHLDQMLAEYQALATDPDLGPNDRKKALGALKERLGPSMAVLQGQGAMSEGERANVDNGLGSPEDWVNVTDAKARVEATKRFFRTKRDGIVSSQVYQDPDATTPWQGAAPRSVRQDQ